MQKKIIFLGTGGTIAGAALSTSDNIGYTAAQVSVSNLLANVEGLAALPHVSEQVCQLDSKDMSFAAWQQLALRTAHWLAQSDVQGVVITHGTDTLEETAFFLQTLLQPHKPVVMTCAMRPATALAPDGPQNILDAVAVAKSPGARGVLVVCSGVVHTAQDVQKNHTYRLDAFSSGDAGPLGFVEEGQLRQLRPWPGANGVLHAGEEGTLDANAAPMTALCAQMEQALEWPRVEIVMNYVGASAAVVQALVAQGVQGLVVAGTGNGTLHVDLAKALQMAQDNGVHVVCTTRCAQGRVLPVAGAALPDSQGLSPVKARIAMMLQLLNKAMA